MPRTRRLVVLGIAVFLTGLIAMFPARVAYRWFAPPNVLLSDIGGSVWSGSAQHANIAGLYLGDLHWRFKPLQLLTAKLAFAVEANPGGGFLKSDVAVGVANKVFLTDLQASVSLAGLEQMFNVRGMRGTANAEFARLILDNGLPTAADGLLQIAGLTMPLVSPSPIGGFKAEFLTNEEGVVASVEDTDGVVDLAGRLLLGADRSYEFLGQLAPKGTTPAELTNQMKFLGSPNERGQYELRLEGAL